MGYVIAVTEKREVDVCLPEKSGHDAKTAGRLQKYMEILGKGKRFCGHRPKQRRT